ncbi:MAG TPA: DPP IV N-terminal domain-containing protein, partial [Fimbriimonas sp.]|nr:DPP IV N-terminal domain-containing protein [Fimbriimonas sp.]
MQGSTIEPRLLRQPDIFGDTVVFVYAGDLWASTTGNGSVARKLATNVGARGGAATAPVARPQISPDGKLVAFTASYDGAENIYVVPIEGGEPRRVTYSNVAQQAIAWTPDGKIAFVTSEGNPYLGRQGQMYLVSPNGGLPESTAIKEITAGSFFASGDKIAYNRVNSYNFNWRRYRGGTQGKISIYDLKNNTYSELPAKREQSYHPQVVGDAIYYISDKSNGSLNLFRNVNGKDTQVTNFDDADIKWPNSDGTNLVFEKDGVLFKYDTKANVASKVNIRVPSENLAARPALKSLVPFMDSVALSPSGARLAMGARGEVFSVPAKTGETRNMTSSGKSREQSVDWSPDGKWISYISDSSGENELYVQPQMGGAPTKLTDGTLKLGTGYIWSPDSKKIILTTIGTEVHILDVESKKITLMDDFLYGGGSYNFSQDSKWIAYTKARENGYRSVVLYEVATGKATKVTEGFFDDSEVCFDKGGKWLFVVSSRNFQPTYGRNEFSLKVEETDRLYAISLRANTPNPFLEKNDEETAGATKTDETPAKTEEGIDLTGMDDRMIALPMPVSSYNRLYSADNGFYYVNN